MGLGGDPRVSLFGRIGKALETAGGYLARPELVRLKAHGVPRSLMVALDQPWLRALKPRTVLDVGANTGQFALAAERVFPGATIHCFEPLADCFTALKEKTARRSRIHCWNLALGEDSGRVAFQRNDYTPSSSMLPLAEHAAAFPHARGVESVEVNMDRLDNLSDRLGISEPLLVKIDVQGYEDRVLRGGRDTIARADVLLVETSFVELYQGQPLHAAICDLLASWGFAYAGALDQLRDPHTGRVLSCDSIFTRS